MPFICKIRTDVPDGILQVLDLDPNESLRNLIYEPPGQTKYVNRVENDLVTLAPVPGGGGAIATTGTGDTSGLRAWLVDNIDAAGPALTAAEATSIATLLINTMDAGTALTLATVNALIDSVVTGAGIGLNTSTGSLTDLLTVMAGGIYSVPSGSVVDTNGSTFNTTVSGSFGDTTYRETLTTGALTISLAEGHLAGFASSTFSYEGTTGAAVVVYDDDGSLL